MENASEALYMAATILIGMIVLSLFVALFYSFSTSGTKIEAKLAESQIKEFNAKYEVFREANKVKMDDDSTKDEYNSLVSIYDIISLINFTNKTNHSNYSAEDISNFINGVENRSSMPYYVTITINFKKNKIKNYVNDVACDLMNSESVKNNFMEEASKADLDVFMKNCYYDLKNPKGDENTDYILRFKCTNIEYSPKTGRVIYIEFEFVEPSWRIIK